MRITRRFSNAGADGPAGPRRRFGDLPRAATLARRDFEVVYHNWDCWLHRTTEAQPSRADLKNSSVTSPGRLAV